MGAGGGAGSDGAEGGQQEDLTTCFPGQVWDVKYRRLQRRSGILPDGEITETPTRSQDRSAIVQPPPLPPPAAMPPEGVCGPLPLDG
jgi:hypothetical protein